MPGVGSESSPTAPPGVTNGSVVTITSSSVHITSSSPAVAATNGTTATPPPELPDNPTAAGFDTGPSFSEARKAFLNRANNQPTTAPPGKSLASSLSQELNQLSSNFKTYLKSNV